MKYCGYLNRPGDSATQTLSQTERSDPEEVLSRVARERSFLSTLAQKLHAKRC